MAIEARCWYLNQKGKAAGPFTFSEIKLMAAEGNLKGHDLVYKEGSSEWKRAYDWTEIAEECFQEEDKSSISRLVNTPEAKKAVEDQWVLLVREEAGTDVRFRQKGPFKTDEIRQMLADGKVKASDHIWKKGDSKWIPIFEIPEFKINNQKMTENAEQALSRVATMPVLSELPASTPASQVVASDAERLEAAALEDEESNVPSHDASVVDWARELVQSEEVRHEQPIGAAAKALIFEPEATKVNIHIPADEPVSEEDAMSAIASDDLGVFNASEEPNFSDEDEVESTRYVPKSAPVAQAKPAPAAEVKVLETPQEVDDEEEDFVMGTPAVLAEKAPPMMAIPPVPEEVPETPKVEEVSPVEEELPPPPPVMAMPAAPPEPPQAPVQPSVPAPPPVAVKPKAPQPTPVSKPQPTPVQKLAQAAALPPEDGELEIEAAVASVKVPQDYTTYEAPEVKSKGFLHNMAPVFGVLIVGIFALGYWATVNTDRSALGIPSPVSYQVEPIKQPRPAVVAQPPPVAPPIQQVPSPVNPPVEASVAQAEQKAEAPKEVLPENAVGINGKPVAQADQKTETQDAKPPAVFKKETEVVKPAAPVEAVASNNPAVKLNAEKNQVEINGPFKKGDLLRIRVEGRPGQILELPALVQRYEVRATQDHLYKIGIKEARIPDGDFQVTVQFGVNKFVRALGLGKDNPQFANDLTAHRKMVVFEQQQEKKRLIKATKELSVLVTQVEAQPQNANNNRKALRDLDRLTPKELRMVRQSRYQLFYGDSWEKLAQQWDKVQSNLKDNPNRNPASIAEFLKIKKATGVLESEVRNLSFWE